MKFRADRFYKIEKDGKFSEGGARPGFNSRGKLWNGSNLGPHLGIVKGYNNNDLYNNAKIIEYELVPTGFEIDCSVGLRDFPININIKNGTSVYLALDICVIHLENETIIIRNDLPKAMERLKELNIITDKKALNIERKLFEKT